MPESSFQSALYLAILDQHGSRPMTMDEAQHHIQELIKLLKAANKKGVQAVRELRELKATDGFSRLTEESLKVTIEEFLKTLNEVRYGSSEATITNFKTVLREMRGTIDRLRTKSEGQIKHIEMLEKQSKRTRQELCDVLGLTVSGNYPNWSSLISSLRRGKAIHERLVERTKDQAAKKIREAIVWPPLPKWLRKEYVLGCVKVHHGELLFVVEYRYTAGEGVYLYGCFPDDSRPTTRLFMDRQVRLVQHPEIDTDEDLAKYLDKDERRAA